MYRLAVAPAIMLAILSAIFLPVYAQTDDYNVIKGKQNETFTFPYQAANRDRNDPLVYTYEQPRGPSWILNIENKLEYVPRDGAKAVIVLREAAPSEKSIQISMWGDESKRYQIAINTSELGHAILYNKDPFGWNPSGTIAVGHANSQGLSANDGTRIVLDRFEINGFSVSSIEVWGKEDPSELGNATGGYMTFFITFGSPENTPTYYVPLALAIAMGGIMAVLLKFKRRK
jgi:hypothetical protein